MMTTALPAVGGDKVVKGATADEGGGGQQESSPVRSN